MSDFTNWRRAFALSAIVLLSTAGIASAAETGNLFGTVKDDQGDGLPGVLVELSGIGAPQVQTTDAQGSFRFLGLDPGTWRLDASLDGFSDLEYPAIVIRVGRNTTIELTLSSAVEETITVTSESPLLDERKLATGTQVSQIELEKIPTARDPWSILNQTPGVILDRINVGGTESGQQAVFRGPGVSDDENNFQVDGVQITDMAAVGASPTYYDFDQFEEMQFTTGSSDVENVSSGVQVNLVTKRGTNEFRGSGRYLLTDKKGYFGGVLASPAPDISGMLAPGQAALTGNELRRVEDIGFEAGGPLKADKIWIWGSWGQNDIKQNAASGDADDTILENTALKLNAQVSSNNSLVGTWNNGDKLKFGRGAGPDRASETTWNQRGPTAVMKLEDTHVFSSSFFLSGQWSKVDGGFSLNTKNNIASGQGGLGGGNESIIDADGVWKNGFLSGFSRRPSEELKADASYFFNTGEMNHEIKFGARYREFDRASDFTWDGGRNLFVQDGAAFGTPFDWVNAQVGDVVESESEYTSLWAQDTITKNNWTLNVGLRYDDQSSKNPAQTRAAHGFFPIPAVNFAGDNGFAWDNITPRIGFTYALGEERDTLLRASYSQYPEQMSHEVTRINPAGDAYAYYGFYDDNTGNPQTGTNQVWWNGEPTFLLFTNGYDPSNPFTSPNAYSPSYEASLTDEIILGVEHALLPEFVVGLTVTLRSITDISEDCPLTIFGGGQARCPNSAADWAPNGVLAGNLPDGTPFAVTRFGIQGAYTGGDLRRTGGRERDYEGISLNFVKRLTNQWMVRGFVNYGDAEWSIPSNWGVNNRLNIDEVGSSVDGGTYAVQSGGSGNKGDVILQSSWSYNVNGMYQVAPDRPWGFNIAANIYGREGTPLPYFFRTSGGGTGSEDILINSGNEIDQFRTDDIMTVDVRLEKEFRATGNMSATFSLDAFNIMNENYELQRERRFNTARYDFLDETLAPNVWRLGFRLNWR